MAVYSSEFKGRLKKYFEKKLGAYDYRNGWMKSSCPYCGHHLGFGINISRNLTHCFRCEAHPSPMFLAMHLENVDTYTEIYNILKSEDYAGYSFKEEWHPAPTLRVNIDLPEGFYLLSQGESQLAKSARSYVKSRGFNPEDLSRQGWGYGTDEKYFGYIIIPFHYQGRLVYFNARNFLGNGPRYNNPDANSIGIGKSYLIYNRDALDMCESIFLCEGVINAATMGERAIAISGKAISRYQTNEIVKSPVKRVTILMDPDAKTEAVDLAIRLCEYKRVKVVFLPDGKDCNDLGRKSVLKYVYRTHYSDYNQLLKLKHDIL